MIAARPLGAPFFGSALLGGKREGGTLRPRRLGRTLAVSILAHALGGAGLVVLSLLSIEPIPEPPIVIRFLAVAPPPPLIVPLHEARRPTTTPPPSQPAFVRPAPEIPPPLMVEPPPRRPEPPPLKVEAADLPIKPGDAAPELRVRDAAPPAPRAGGAALAPVAVAPVPQTGGGEEPDLVFLTPGKARARGSGGGIAGAGDGLPPLPGAEAAGGSAGGGRRAGAGGALNERGLGTEASFDATGLASSLGRRYGVALIEAARLGQRTSDGARYSLLVPELSEAYRRILFRGAWRAQRPDDSGVVSAQVDREAIAIRYSDGTLQVVMPTRDGLVALYVSADGRGRPGLSKVDEAERALGALHRLAQVRG